ncbi:MAG: hypothetical protein AAF517_12495, partial [Planctomycetota bacterium]
REGRTVVVPLGELYASQTRSILWKFKISPAAKGDVSKLSLGTISLRYLDGRDNKVRSDQRAALALQRSSDPAVIEENRNSEIEARVTELALAASMEEAARLVEAGKFDEAKRRLGAATNEARQRLGRLSGQQKDAVEQSIQDIERLRQQVEDAKKNPRAAGSVVKESKARSFRLKKK